MDPARAVAGEHLVGQRRQNEILRLHGAPGQPCRCEGKLGARDTSDQKPTKLCRRHLIQPVAQLVDHVFADSGGVDPSVEEPAPGFGELKRLG